MHSHHQISRILLPVTVFFLLLVFSSCKKDKDPIFHIKPSTGEEVTFNGLADDEPGSEAGNSVYLSLRDGKTTDVLRESWDMGFYSGPEFRVILNNTTSAGVKVLDKYDLSQVGGSDTIGLSLAVSPFDPQPEDLAFFDDNEGDLTKTAIPAISADDAKNPVIILNRGTGGGISPRPWVKLRILQNENGYTLQYAGIDDESFKILNIAKDVDYNFQFVSVDNGIVSAEPEKNKWDIVWSYAIFNTNFGWGEVPYNFSDMIAVNYLSNVGVAQKVYADDAIAADAYEAFNKDSLDHIQLSFDRWSVGSSWRATQPALGALQDRFYVIKDVNGNFYKFKAIAMGVGADGGVRGKPEFKYELIQQ